MLLIIDSLIIVITAKALHLYLCTIKVRDFSNKVKKKHSLYKQHNKNKIQSKIIQNFIPNLKIINYKSILTTTNFLIFKHNFFNRNVLYFIRITV